MHVHVHMFTCIALLFLEGESYLCGQILTGEDLESLHSFDSEVQRLMHCMIIQSTCRCGQMSQHPFPRI